MMSRIPFPLALVPLALLCWSCDDDPGGGAADAGDTDSEDTDSGEESWAGVSIAAASAPDELHVRVALDGPLPPGLAADPASWVVESARGPTAVTGAAVDTETGQVLLETARQRLGETCTVSVVHETAGEGLEAQFVAADTCRFWVADFASWGYEKYQIVADRVSVGSTCAVYVQQGQAAAGAAEAVSRFDGTIFPTLTTLFTDPPDQDGNGRIVILGLDGQGYYGGYFDPTDTISDAQSMAWWGIHSNEMELVYINVEDGHLDSETVVPHEFQHLLYQERHGFTDPYWEYHNEGLSEAAVRIVNGYHPWAVDYYFWDYQGLIGAGLSLVNWTYAQYENYAQAYLFLNYVAGRLDGVDTFGDLFDFPTGSPEEFEAFLQQELGQGMNAVHRDQLLATWVRDETGVYGYNGMITNFPAGQKPPRVTPGTASVDLQPFAGAFFPLGVDEVDYPDTQGEHIVYAGIDAAGNVDLEAPFAVAGGALLAYNEYFEWLFWTPEHSGPDLPATGGWLVEPSPPTPAEGRISPTWLDPPPYNPYAPERFERWQAAARARVGDQSASGGRSKR
jgi:hypothetical protein